MKLLTLNLLYLIIQCQPNQQQSNSDDDNLFYNNITTSSEEEINVSQFLTTILIVGLTLLCLSKLCQKKTHPIDKNRNNINLDELNQRMNSVAQKLQDGNMELTYSFNGQWVQQKVEKVSVQQNVDTLTFHFNGSDCYGSWNQIGVINISQSNQVDTFSRKMYDNAKIQDGDVLIYYGQFDDQDQSFKGHWYYLESKEKGEWLLKFK